jgi:hypothetical protein
MSFTTMKNLFSIRPGVVLAVALAISISGCGGSSSSSNNSIPSSAAPASGNWQIALTPSKGDKTSETLAGFLLNTNTGTASGAFLFTDSPCTDVGNVSGTVSGTTVNLEIAPDGAQVELTGSLDSGNSSMSGTYNILADGCSDAGVSPQTGTWAGNLVSPMSGTISNGTFTSGLDQNQNVPPYPLQGTITQGSNVGSTNAVLTGTLSVLANSANTNYCITDTLNINGSISGTAVVINLSDSTTNAQVGQITGTISLDGTTFSGKYNILPTGVKPCANGDHGFVAFTL